jgi:hypothetical protein
MLCLQGTYCCVQYCVTYCCVQYCVSPGHLLLCVSRALTAMCLQGTYCSVLNGCCRVYRFKKCASPFNWTHRDNGPRGWPNWVCSAVHENTNTDEIETKSQWAIINQTELSSGRTGMHGQAARLPPCHWMRVPRPECSEVLHSGRLLALVYMSAVWLRHTRPNCGSWAAYSSQKKCCSVPFVTWIKRTWVPCMEWLHLNTCATQSTSVCGSWTSENCLHTWLWSSVSSATSR